MADALKRPEGEAARQRLEHAPVTVLVPSKGWALPSLRELVSYRDLLFFLMIRNIKVRYRQTLLGGLWAIIQPLLTMVMLTVVFGKLIGVPSDGVPYWIFALAGLVLWTFISQTVSAASSSLINSSELVKKVYFPRLAIPIATVMAGLIDFAIAFAMLVVVLVAIGMFPGIRIILCIGIALLAALMVLGVGAALAALAVRFRDVSYVVPFALQLWLFATPVAYPITIVPERWRLLLALNPATGLIELFRWAALGTAGNPWPAFAVSTASLLVLLLFGLLLFRRMERSFADVI
jgi:lipopolysaccharide transport system permease protein